MTKFIALAAALGFSTLAVAPAFSEAPPCHLPQVNPYVACTDKLKAKTPKAAQIKTSKSTKVVAPAAIKAPRNR